MKIDKHLKMSEIELEGWLSWQNRVIMKAVQDIKDKEWNEAIDACIENAECSTRKAIFPEGEWEEGYLIKESLEKLKR